METFKEFEHAGWQMVAGSYHDYFAELTRQAVNPLLSAVGCGSGLTLLDIASGPGYVAAEASSRGALVTGLDFSSEMVNRAQLLYPGLRFVEGDAQALPFADASFELAVMNFGLLHLDKPEAALQEAFRVLKPKGRFAFSVWAPASQSVGFQIALRSVERHGNSKVPLPPGPPFFRFSEESESTNALMQAGFTRTQSQTVPMTWHLKTGADLFKAFYQGTPRTGGLLRAQAPGDLQAIEQEMVAAARAFEKGSAIEIPMASCVFSAYKD
jgi:SAM-dependent methyltransferase